MPLTNHDFNVETKLISRYETSIWDNDIINLIAKDAGLATYFISPMVISFKREYIYLEQ
jgi:hypothetical protein